MKSIAEVKELMSSSCESFISKYLNTFDLLSPKYEQPQRIKTVQRWFKDAGLIYIEVAEGCNGIEGRGKRKN